MAEPSEESEVERIIIAAIYRHSRGNVIYLARAIVADLRKAGFEIRRTGVDDAPGAAGAR